MTSLLLAFVLSTPVPVVEMPVRDSNVIVLQAWFRTPSADRAEIAGLRVLGETMLRGTAQYTEKQFAETATQAGIAPDSIVGDGWIRLQIAVPKGELDLGVGLLESVVTAPSLESRTIQAVTKRLRSNSRSLWQFVIDPLIIDYSTISVNEVRSIYTKFIRPENAQFAVGGAVGGAHPAKPKLDDRFKFWKAKTVVSRIPMPPAEVVKRIPTKASLIQLISSPIFHTSRADYAKLVAASAMGVGKSSTVYRILREELGLTYLQRLILVPTAKGYLPKIVFATAGKLTQNEDLFQTKEKLSKDIESWSDLSLEIAKSMLLQSIDGTNPATPFWFSDAEPLGEDVASQLAFDAYAALIDQSGLFRAAMKAGIAKVDLEEMRLAGKNLLRDCKVQAFIGSG